MPDVNWGYHTADTSRSRRFLKHLDDNFIVVQVLREPTRKGALLDLENREGLVGMWQLAAILVIVTMKRLSLKFLVTGGNCHQNFSPGYGESRLQAAQGAS